MNLKTADRLYLVIMAVMMIMLPLGISAYDRYVWDKKIPDNARVFNLTGHTQKGWVEGKIEAADVLLDSLDSNQHIPPVLYVHQGDTVVLKLTSSDVVHGFSLKDFGIFINDGIHPGRPVIVTFVADKTGTFTFACNAICGSFHENMFGTIVVSA